MSLWKSSIQEFQHQFKDVRSQLCDQMKCLEQRTSDQMAIFQEINDFVKKRAELDLQYSKELDKLVRSVMLKHKNEKQRRTNWFLYSICNLWQQMVDDAKEEAKQRAIMAEVALNNVVPSITNKSATLQKISKKCREVGQMAQGEVVRVINELSLAMKTYQHCYDQFSVLGTKLQHADEQKRKTMDAANSSTRKQRSVQKTYDKKSEKYEVARQKCTRARNEYLLCIDAANASLYKYFADDISDIVDCCDLGLNWWLGLVLQNLISARKSACQTEMNALANLSSFKDSLTSQADKQRFFENNHQIFMLPRQFHFKCEPSEKFSKILTENLVEEFKQRHHQIRKRLNTLRTESEMSWKSMEEMEKQMRDLLTASTLVEINEFGIADNRPPIEGLESDLNRLNESYLQTFSFFLLNANLITRLEARADGIGEGLKDANLDEEAILTTPKHSLVTQVEGFDGHMINSPISKDIRMSLDRSPEIQHRQLDNMNRKKRRIGSQASTEQQPSPWARPRLFGGSLEEYTEATGEPIPTVVISCIRVLSQFALQHQGLFRISGSQIEINRMRDAFETGDDPLKNVKDASDANSIAGLLKLYFRELREPLFPFYLFDLITDCAKCASIADFFAKISPLLNKLPRPAYLLLRYLFAFLNHLSEFSDENMMDPYNLAICFGPTLLPIPEGKDQVIHQNSVNEVVKNLIVHCDSVFTQRIAGPRYEKYSFSTLGTPAETELELFMDDEVEENPQQQQKIENSTLNRGLGRNEHAGNGFEHQPPFTPHQAHSRLPFLANYPRTSADQFSQSLMNYSTYSTNSSHLDQGSQISGAIQQFDHNSNNNNRPEAIQQATVDFSNNYSSTESGIGHGLTQKISGLRLISPSQKRSDIANLQKNQQLTSKDGHANQERNGQNDMDLAELYASIKRSERIRIPIIPMQKVQANENSHEIQPPTERPNDSYQQQQHSLNSDAVAPPPYHSLYNSKRIRPNNLLEDEQEPAEMRSPGNISFDQQLDNNSRKGNESYGSCMKVENNQKQQNTIDELLTKLSSYDTPTTTTSNIT